MADSDAEADALERLEAALDRIAMRAQPAPSEPRVDTPAIAARLDRLIGQMHDALNIGQMHDALDAGQMHDALNIGQAHDALDAAQMHDALDMSAPADHAAVREV